MHKATINKALDIELDKAIYNWIDFNRSLGNPITSWAIDTEIIKKDPIKKISNLSPYYPLFIDS